MFPRKIMMADFVHNKRMDADFIAENSCLFPTCSLGSHFAFYFNFIKKSQI